MLRVPSFESVRVVARELRRTQTPAEEALWRLLRNRGLARLKFRRQVPVGRFVVDFLCPRMRLVVEVDGEIHRAAEGRDEARTRELESLGYSVIRFSNDQVLAEPDLVLRDIETAVRR
jgi:very-short-patch-repair endonuclease